jgi:hypothetical protein
MDAKRKEGIKAIKDRLAKMVIDNTEMTLADKIARL